MGVSLLPFPFLLEATGKSGHEVGPQLTEAVSYSKTAENQWEPKRTIFVIVYFAESASPSYYHKPFGEGNFEK